ncbi:SDR family oxidoreductase [Epilithonimonas zeae]|uniref:SDR family oxidoreductase n=1 Tax=Epilithonimonas zeae TaxID=1416779 RepID=UPI00200EBCD9|nr:SDR family NAD(P)-dependent oxidoreductase [Epilithonimonas zeae]UQB67150.1 SDR family NAD(P)-dependent oxidoreductase [Epilithonimonas zeae]
MKTTNNTVFISGGSAGIGLEIAKSFSEKGNKVIINGRNRERLDNALEQLENAVAIQGDLSIESERIRIANELIQNHPDVNIVINNAGEAYYYNLADNSNTYELAKKEINTNYLTIIHFTDLLLPHLLQKEDAALVNVTSIASLVSYAPIPTYAASKAALRSYTQSLRNALKATSVKIFEVLPPLVNTSFSTEIGGENGIPPKEVADELLIALEQNQFDVPVGQTKVVLGAFQEALSKLSQN